MRKAAVIIIIAFLYAVTSLLGFSLAANNSLVSPVWPPAGIALASVLIFGNIALIGIFIGCYLANAHIFLSTDFSLSATIFMFVPAIGGAIQAYLGKSFLVRFTGSTNIFQNTNSVLIFILISAFGACIVNASISTPLLVFIEKSSFRDLPYQWLTWWIADAVGVIAIASIIISWASAEKLNFSNIKLLRLLCTWAMLLLIGLITISSKLELTYVFIPVAIWAAFQFDLRFSLLTGLLISAICIYDSAYTSSQLMHVTSVNTSISLMQLFIAIIYLTILLIHAILSDREKAYQKLQLLNSELEQIVLERTSALTESNKELEAQKNKAIEAFESLKKSHARLMQSEKMASLGMLTAGVAHEIKHPLNATTANMESIPQILEQFSSHMQEKKANETLKNNFKEIEKNINSLIAASQVGITRTAGVIADLCAFARLDEPEMVMTELNRNIDSTLNLLSSEIKSNIKIVKEYGEIPSILCHPGKINQVLMNILINAIHALQTRPNSSISIKTECINNSIIISIKDNGPGMPQAVLEKLFTPFMTTKSEGMGSGLGLFISKNIIKEHHGKINVMSTLDEGTEFVIRLPIEE